MPTTTIERRAPADLQAEAHLLGALMLDGRGDIIDEVATILRPEDLFSDRHKALLRLMLARREAGRAVDLVVLVPAIIAAGMVEEVGGIAYVASLPDHAPVPEYAPALARSIRDHADRRAWAQRGIELREQALDPSTDPTALAGQVDRWAGQGADRGQEAPTMVDLTCAVLERTEALHRREVASGLPGLPGTLARLLRLPRGQQTVMAARPAMGKSALATTVAVRAAEAGHGVAVFSLEMDAADVVSRMAAAAGRVNLGGMLEGNLDAGQWDALHTTLERLSRLPIVIRDDREVTVETIRRQARQAKRKMAIQGVTLGLVIVDYVGLVQATDGRESRQQQLAHVSRSLRAMAKDLDVHVILLSQLNRQCEQRADKRPMLSDLREAGDLEQDADAVVLLYRDEVYTEHHSRYPGLGEAIVAKNRHGATGTAFLRWDGPTVAWGDEVLDARRVRADAAEGGGGWS